MSFIERALEQMGQAKPPEGTGPAPAAAKPAPPAEAPRPPARPSEGRAEKPAAPPGADAARAMPCRRDRQLEADLAGLRQAGVIGPEDEDRRLAEEYRIIKRPLLKAMSGASATPLSNVLVVTSAVPGEGKTFTSLNLALSLALERNREVVLIDGDVAKRDITHLFGLDEEPGLLDAAGTTEHELADVILKTDVPALYIMPAGNQDLQATEILGSERTAALLASLASDPRRIVLIDSPPLLVTSEAGVLTSLAGQVVLVVKASETPQDVVVRAVESIAEDKPVSLLLNQVLSVPEHSYSRYGYYGEYGYGYGRKSEKKDAAADQASDPD